MWINSEYCHYHCHYHLFFFDLMNMWTGLLDWHEKIIAESLSKPWYPLKSFFTAICKFFECGKKKKKVKEKESKIVNSRSNKKNKYNYYEDEDEDEDDNF